ncbi:glycerophosphodiester phosphodiesterase family protein [Blastococcus brunescens]|uniref:glycerophosphodiester phosphodiesterase n=1 Tax=Blastococcus brunescens TaxID=1564165 RepID=A0ABZ1AXN1_9ACTN|nr:glycerophosphodiester phosphodiesterase family protein [Blastococcus sp. BMG 8361]WRL63327.1 glycerophosphodiester phosphodiesterase family protein [Blastococcus sp. BMG 8361]
MRATESLAARPATRLPRPVVIGHRGAPAYRPEHTVASYELAIELGAELIEPDVVISRDGALVVRHESELSWSTDVAGRPEFADRHTTKEHDGVQCTGWFTEDFTLAELRTLRAVERMPEYRPLNTAYDGHFGILTLAEVIDLARDRSTSDRRIRVLAELKHPAWSDEQGLPMAELVADELRRLEATDQQGPVLLQSFDAGLLRDLRGRLGEQGPEMVQLVNDAAAGDRMVTRAGLREISTYAQGIAPSVERVLRSVHPVRGTSSLVSEARRAAWPSSRGPCGRRTPSCPSTSASAPSPRHWAMRSASPVSCSPSASTASSPTPRARRPRRRRTGPHRGLTSGARRVPEEGRRAALRTEGSQGLTEHRRAAISSLNRSSP